MPAQRPAQHPLQPVEWRFGTELDAGVDRTYQGWTDGGVVNTWDVVYVTTDVRDQVAADWTRDDFPTDMVDDLRDPDRVIRGGLVHLVDYTTQVVGPWTGPLPEQADCPYQHHDFVAGDDDPTHCLFDLTTADRHHAAHLVARVDAALAELDDAAATVDEYGEPAAPCRCYPPHTLAQRRSVHVPPLPCQLPALAGVVQGAVVGAVDPDTVLAAVSALSSDDEPDLRRALVDYLGDPSAQDYHSRDLLVADRWNADLLAVAVAWLDDYQPAGPTTGLPADPRATRADAAALDDGLQAARRAWLDWSNAWLDVRDQLDQSADPTWQTLARRLHAYQVGLGTDAGMGRSMDAYLDDVADLVDRAGQCNVDLDPDEPGHYTCDSRSTLPHCYTCNAHHGPTITCDTAAAFESADAQLRGWAS